jgi:predicted ATPase/class 3 adenylate cyclase
MGEIGTHSESELAYVVFADLVSYSTLPIESQIEITDRFKAVVRKTCGLDEPNGALALDSGDGVALVYLGGSSKAIEHAIELCGELKALEIGARMGIHCGPITRVEDVNGQMTVVGPAINMAERVQSCADPGQLLLSGAAADAASAHGSWRSGLEDLGEHEVKHGVKLRLANLVTEGCGVSGVPSRIQQARSAAPESRTRNNLPSSLTSFVGRSTEIENLSTYLKHARLISLIGSGGIGKTRLSVEVAGRNLELFPGGAWFVPLEGIQDGRLVTQEVAAVFGFGDAPGAPMIDRLTEFLKGQKLLLVLDNCEHVLRASAELVQKLTSACPELTVLATSREVLSIPGELVVKVRSLSTPRLRVSTGAKWVDQGGAQIRSFEAVRLFLDRAIHANPSFRVTDDNLGTICKITSRLDGIPLAIELAAARVRMMTPEQLFDRLDNAFAVCRISGSTISARHQTIRATIDWSFNLLSDQEKLLFQRLGVFYGSFSLDAAESVSSLGLDEDFLDVLSSLVDKSLLLAEEHYGQMRYRMLETVRQYARELLTATPDFAKVQANHLKFYSQLGAEAKVSLQSPDQVKWRRSFDLDMDNVRAAIDWALECGENLPVAAKIACDIFYFWFEAGYFSEARSYFERIREALPTNEEEALGIRLAVLGGALTVYMGNVDGFELMEEGLKLAESRHEDLILFCVSWLADCYYLAGDEQSAYTYLTKRLELAEMSGSSKDQGFALASLSAIECERGNFEAAEHLIAQMLSNKEAEQDQKGIGLAHCHLGHLYQMQGKAEAIQHYRKGIALIGSPPDYYLLAGNLCPATLILLEAGDPEGAATIQGYADNLVARTGALPDRLFVRLGSLAKEQTRKLCRTTELYEAHYQGGRTRPLAEVISLLCEQRTGEEEFRQAKTFTVPLSK